MGLKGRVEVMEIQMQQNNDKLEINENLLKKLYAELSHKDDIITFQKLEFGKIVEFYKKEYSSAK